jgi:transposase, IS5 family
LLGRLEEYDLGRPLFDEVQRQLAAKGLKIARGTIVDATIIDAPSSTKNADKARDPEMHQTKKGNQWYFGMKAHFGVDSRTKLIHAVVATPANVADSTVLPELLHGQETRVWGGQAYRGQRAVIREHAPKARDYHPVGKSAFRARILGTNRQFSLEKSAPVPRGDAGINAPVGGCVAVLRASLDWPVVVRGWIGPT